MSCWRFTCRHQLLTADIAFTHIKIIITGISGDRFIRHFHYAIHQTIHELAIMQVITNAPLYSFSQSSSQIMVSRSKWLVGSSINKTSVVGREFLRAQSSFSNHHWKIPPGDCNQPGRYPSPLKFLLHDDQDCVRRALRTHAVVAVLLHHFHHCIIVKFALEPWSWRSHFAIAAASFRYAAYSSHHFFQSRAPFHSATSWRNIRSLFFQKKLRFRIRMFLPGNDSENGRLPCSVRSDQTYLISGRTWKLALEYKICSP